MKLKVVIINSLISLVLTSAGAYAGETFGTVSGTITKIRIDANGRAMIYFDKPIEGGTPACVHSSYSTALAIDASTEGGKAVLSMAMLAKVNQSNVKAHGFGKCSVYSVVEDWNHGFLN